MRQYNFPESEYPDNWPSLNKLVETTRLGTFDILLGEVNDLTEIKELDKYEIHSLYTYLILKKLVNNQKEFLNLSIELASLKNIYANTWIEKVFKKTILSPELPDVRSFNANEFYNTYKKWGEDNYDSITFSNKSLFPSNFK